MSAVKLSSLVWLLPLALLALVLYIGVSALHGHASGPEKPPVAVDVNAAKYPRTIEESGGHRVVIPARPMRIVASDCGPADMLTALVDSSRIAALPGPVEAYGGAQEYYKAHPEIPRFAKFDSETILALKPDLVLFTTYRDAAIAEYLESRGIPVIRFENFKTFAGIRGAILAVGSAVGEEEKAQNVVADFDRRLSAVDRALTGRKSVRALSYSNYGQGFAIGGGESQDELIRRAGAENAATELNLKGHVNFSFEQLLKLNPDWIIVDGDHGFDSAQAKFLLTQSELEGLGPIKARRIAVVPDRYYSSISQYIVNAVEILARQLHPDAFPPTPSQNESTH